MASLGVLGLLDSLYFIFVAQGWMRPDSRLIPAFCRMDEGSCARIVDAPQARALRVPNSLLGVLWYSGLATTGILAGLGILPSVAFVPLLAGGLAALLLSAWLAFQLKFRLRVACPLCYAAHAINATAVVSIILMWAAP